MKASVNSLHHQEGDWLRELEFYNFETDVLTKRISALLPSSSGAQKTRLEEFLSIFAGVKKQCDKLTIENRERYDRVDQLAAADPEHIETEFSGDKDEMYKQMEDFTAGFRKARFDLNIFLVKGQ